MKDCMHPHRDIPSAATGQIFAFSERLCRQLTETDRCYSFSPQNVGTERGHELRF